LLLLLLLLLISRTTSSARRGCKNTVTVSAFLSFNRISWVMFAADEAFMFMPL
jgi:hypothetical protein